MFQHFCMLLLIIQGCINLSISKPAPDAEYENFDAYETLPNVGETYEGTFPPTTTMSPTTTTDKITTTTQKPRRRAIVKNGEAFHGMISPNKGCTLELTEDGAIQIEHNEAIRWSSYSDDSLSNATARFHNGQLVVATPDNMHDYVAMSVDPEQPNWLSLYLSDKGILACFKNIANQKQVVWRSDLIQLDQTLKPDSVLFSENGKYGFYLDYDEENSQCRVMRSTAGHEYDDEVFSYEGYCKLKLTSKGVALYDYEGKEIKQLDSGKCAGTDSVTVSDVSGNLLCNKGNDFKYCIQLEKKNFQPELE